MACDGKSSLTHAPLGDFTDEQRAYLERLLEQHDLATVYKPAAPAQADMTVHGTPWEDLTSQEQWKKQEPPFELWPKLRAHAANDAFPDARDTFMFKHHGLFNVRPAQPGFMCRLRIPACKIRAEQLHGLADLAERFAGGYAHVTTRGNLQIREIPPRHIIRVLEGLSHHGLTSKGAGADSVRNITANPTAGFDPEEWIDLSPHAIALHHHILNTPSLHGIPRKFNIAFDGGGRISAVVDTNDIGFLAARRRPEHRDPEHPEHDLLCRILLGGITGHGDFARDTGCACLPHQTVDVAVAMLNVFIENADRTNRKRARLKYLLDDWGFEKFIAETEQRLDFTLQLIDPATLEPRGPIDRQGHIGVHPQREPDLQYLGVALPVGRMSVEQMRGLANIALQFGAGDMRLTVWQNLLIPHVPREQVDRALAALREIGLDVNASSFATGVVACTGRTGCQYASTHTKEHALDLADRLQQRFKLDQPINIHLTGCTNSCAQHYIGDIGLLGASTEDGREAYQIFLGGGCDHNQHLARHLAGPIPIEDLEPFCANLIQTWLDQREPEQSFVDFANQRDDAQLRETFLQPATVTEA